MKKQVALLRGINVTGRNMIPMAELQEERSMSEIYVSTDVEADGPIPGPHSLLSFASAVFDRKGALIATFSANLELLPDAKGHPDTMAWWQKNQEAWDAHRKELQAPEAAMKAYAQWLDALPGKPVFVGYPATYDFMFVYWYLMRFAGRSPFSFAGLDIKTLAMVALRCEYREATKRRMPRSWFRAGLPHTHQALDDAKEQGHLFLEVLNAIRTRGA